MDILEMLHARGVFWNRAENGEWQSGFWSWLNIQELINPPATPLTWTPNRPAGIWWWRASRVLQDFALDKSPREVIDEFPMFSYLLGDLHPHVLAMPFALLAIGLALNIFLQLREVSSDRLILLRWMKKPDFWLTALALGALAFLNTWDFPIFLALFSAAAVLNSFLRAGWRFEILWDFLTMTIVLGLVGIALYFPVLSNFCFPSEWNLTQPGLLHPRDPFMDHVWDPVATRDHLDGLDLEETRIIYRIEARWAFCYQYYRWPLGCIKPGGTASVDF